MLPTQDKEAMMKTETAILHFIKTLTIGLTETKPEIFYTEGNVEKCRAEILNILENLGYHKGLPPSIEEALSMRSNFPQEVGGVPKKYD